MSAQNFLTLAITEVQPEIHNYYVVAMEERSQNIALLELEKEQIISSTGKAFWDIGFVTRVDGTVKMKVANNLKSPFVVEGTTELVQNRIASLKALLEAKSASPAKFFDNTNQRFCILKVDKVRAIRMSTKNNVISHYLSIDVNGLPTDKNPCFLLNKDYRWKSFWNWTFEHEVYAEKQEKYLKLLNGRVKQLYLILYRHYFSANDFNQWIVGMHWL